MAKVTQFNKMTAKQMRSIIEAKFAEIEKETGVKLSIGNIGFTQTTFRTKIDGVIAEKADETAQADWNRKCIYYGLSDKDFGKMFVSQGITMKMVRIDTKKYKMPIICEGNDGKMYKFSEMSIKMLAKI